jgi:hypothetical protein
LLDKRPPTIFSIKGRSGDWAGADHGAWRRSSCSRFPNAALLCGPQFAAELNALL